MSDMTPLEAAEAFLETTKNQPPAAWIGKAWGAVGEPRYLTYATVRALVDQIRYDERRRAALEERVEELTKRLEEADLL